VSQLPDPHAEDGLYDGGLVRRFAGPSPGRGSDSGQNDDPQLPTTAGEVPVTEVIFEVVPDLLEDGRALR
jgi:hypothetical protein